MKISATGNYDIDASRDVLLLVSGGTTIAATVQIKNGAGVFVNLPSQGGNEIVSEAFFRKLQAGLNIKYRLNVTAIAGDWEVDTFDKVHG